MTENRSRPAPASWALPKFQFQVKIGGATMGFSEITGLSADSQPIEYRRGDRAGFSTVKMPGLRKSGAVTLKRGVFRGDAELFGWLQRGAAGSVERKPVTITLIDEIGNPATTWTLTNAHPTKFAASDLSATGNEVAVETIELGYEGLTLENP